MPSRQVRHPIFARFYARLSAAMEVNGVGAYRQQLLAGLAGSVLEVGAGNGLNFSHYPRTVSRVVAIEPEPHLRERALVSARSASVPITVLDGTAERLPAGDGEFDAVVATLMLCSVSDPGLALREMHRVLRPGGELCFMEHVLAESAGRRRIQRLADATCWPVCFGGCHASRDAVAAISAAGFSVRELVLYRVPNTRTPWPTAPHARGVAIRS
jgi:ubiquinone/menaquinone biosynthesis C-methylase UbiE